MTSLSIRLEARSAAHRCYRAYAIDVATDLFGAWLVDMRGSLWGKSGSTASMPGVYEGAPSSTRQKTKRYRPDHSAAGVGFYPKSGSWL